MKTPRYKIFCDLDNTLISSFTTRPERGKVKKITLADGWTCWTELREEALESVQWLIDTFGAENVYALTSSITEYAHKIAETFGLKFEKIYAREDFYFPTHDAIYPVCEATQEEDVVPILLDDLGRVSNRVKVDFLGPHTVYVKVPAFYTVEPLNGGLLDFVKNAIMLETEDTTESSNE